jgi:hypothetical protein
MERRVRLGNAATMGCVLLDMAVLLGLSGMRMHVPYQYYSLRMRSRQRRYGPDLATAGITMVRPVQPRAQRRAVTVHDVPAGLHGWRRVGPSSRAPGCQDPRWRGNV